jgi:transcriptional regulator
MQKWGSTASGKHSEKMPDSGFRKIPEVNTIRQELIRVLSEGQCGVKALSKTLRMSEKEIYEHLSHINRSIKSHGKKLLIVPAVCLECGYSFEGRNRFTPPGKCPKCKGEHIQDPEYSII